MYTARALNNLGRRTSQLRQGHSHAERVLSTGDSLSAEVLATHRASVFVLLAAAVEVFVREFVEDVLHELNRRSIRCDMLQPSLLTMLTSPDFDSLRSIGGLGMWHKRVGVLGAVFSAVPAQFSLTVRPHDGRTIRPRHLDAIWAVFSFPRTPLANKAHGLALTELAATRNDIAHGHVDPVSFGRKKTSNDVSRAIDRVDDIAVEMEIAADEYFTKALYLR